VIKFSKKFNVFYDYKEDKWLEEKCKDESCVFCKDRPEKPSLVKRKKFFSFNFDIFKRKK
jgi:hypothetical protein